MKKILIFSMLAAIITTISMIDCKAENLYKYIFRPKAVSLAECEKVKNQYGISVCTVDGDYWVGAVIACGGVRNLPSSNDFYKISEKILDEMIEEYDPSYFNEYYSYINKIAFYSDTPYQKKAVDNDAMWLAKKWQNWRYNVNYNKINGYSISIDTKYSSASSLRALSRAYNEYVNEEKRKNEEWNTNHPDDKRSLSVRSRYDYMKSKIGEYGFHTLYRDNYDLEAYAICRNDFVRY